MTDELNLLIDLCNAYDKMGSGLKFRLAQVLEGDRLSNHPDIALREIADWLWLAIPFLDEWKVAADLADHIEMYLFEDSGSGI